MQNFAKLNSNKKVESEKRTGPLIKNTI